MSNVEHAFENFLTSYLYNDKDFFNKWEKNDINLQYMSEDEIRAVKICGMYVLHNIFEWDKEKLKEIYGGI